MTVTDSGADAFTVQAKANAAGLVVFSETYEKGWRAYVNGEGVDILRTNHALRGVPVSAGTHTIEMRYEPTGLQIGLWTSGVSSLAVLIVFVMTLGDIARSGASATGSSATAERATRSAIIRSRSKRRPPTHPALPA